MSRELTERERAEIEALTALSDDQIDTHDIPEAPAENWLQARRPAADQPGSRRSNR